MTISDYFEKAENELGKNDIEAVYVSCYNEAIKNGDKESAQWFGDHVIHAISQRWIDTYVKPTGMIKS